MSRHMQQRACEVWRHHRLLLLCRSNVGAQDVWWQCIRGADPCWSPPLLVNREHMGGQGSILHAKKEIYIHTYEPRGPLPSKSNVMTQLHLQFTC